MNKEILKKIETTRKKFKCLVCACGIIAIWSFSCGQASDNISGEVDPLFRDFPLSPFLVNMTHLPEDVIDEDFFDPCSTSFNNSFPDSTPYAELLIMIRPMKSFLCRASRILNTRVSQVTLSSSNRTSGTLNFVNFLDNSITATANIHFNRIEQDYIINNDDLNLWDNNLWYSTLWVSAINLNLDASDSAENPNLKYAKILGNFGSRSKPIQFTSILQGDNGKRFITFYCRYREEYNEHTCNTFLAFDFFNSNGDSLGNIFIKMEISVDNNSPNTFESQIKTAILSETGFIYNESDCESTFDSIETTLGFNDQSCSQSFEQDEFALATFSDTQITQAFYDSVVEIPNLPQNIPIYGGISTSDILNLNHTKISETLKRFILYSATATNSLLDRTLFYDEILNNQISVDASFF